MAKRRKIFLILTVLWMAFIFFMSSKDAASSTGDSSRVGNGICKVLIRGFDELSTADQDAIVVDLQTPIRKSAHFIEYTVLGVLCFNAFKPAAAAALIASLYAVSDEIHQLFVPGRSCELRDMIIDIAGISFGILLIMLFKKILKRPE